MQRSAAACANLVEGIIRNICEIVFNSCHWLRRCHLKIFLFLALVAILFSGANLCLWIYIEFGPVLKEEVSFKDISISSSDGHFVLWSRTVCASLVEGITNISVKFY